MSDGKRDKGSVIYRIGWQLCRFLFFTLRKARARGLENIPPDGAFIAAPNHASYIDPPLVGASCNFALNYMAKKELFSVPVLGWILPKINVFPVERTSSDIGAVRTALKILSDGKPLLLFPEGTRGKSRKILKTPKLGVGYFASRANVPVLPVRVVNTDSFFSPHKPIEVIWGKPMYPPQSGEKANYSAFTSKIIEAIYQLK